jgi:hypothetical protein
MTLGEGPNGSRAVAAEATECTQDPRGSTPGTDSRDDIKAARRMVEATSGRCFLLVLGERRVRDRFTCLRGGRILSHPHPSRERATA